ncbi:TVP38/TMEM64 family protein [Mycolicibacter arupensis]|uniref:TVP38/TMEM64 family membrane protein n=1 Tax=Mycolicibacter arupensis TaxID=342002 RepID=A0A0F5N131_9MYCO|nr:TVP38/TMEM64 family protein [Mycolicibacter arupensis]KKC00590.1 membrane protein [Mycolicibacter arupensis]MCV7275499.1 TVP38/TMEM64 family protein [Mycolicibacter arupensis]ORA00505.1 TVP38/TMEM64 family protein [Mycolicibacter arupensis]
MTSAATRIPQVLRGAWAAFIGTARQVALRRLALTTTVLASLVAVALLVPVPTAVQLRDWAQTLGPWFPLAFLAAHTLVTVFPFPRTAFTLAAGLLFGPWLGVVLAVVASALSAVATLILMRVFGWQVSRLVRHPRLDAVNARLRRRGWPAVVSLRLIPAIPFSVINYAAGASAVRALPYTLATLVGLLPGTAAVVVLGDALTGEVSPLLFAVSACTAAVGVALLAYEIRMHRRHRPGPDTQAYRIDPAEPAAIG